MKKIAFKKLMFVQISTFHSTSKVLEQKLCCKPTLLLLIKITTTIWFLNEVYEPKKNVKISQKNSSSSPELQSKNKESRRTKVSDQQINRTMPAEKTKHLKFEKLK